MFLLRRVLDLFSCGKKCWLWVRQLDAFSCLHSQWMLLGHFHHCPYCNMLTFELWPESEWDVSTLSDMHWRCMTGRAHTLSTNISHPISWCHALIRGYNKLIQNNVADHKGDEGEVEVRSGQRQDEQDKVEYRSVGVWCTWNMLRGTYKDSEWRAWAKKWVSPPTHLLVMLSCPCEKLQGIGPVSSSQKLERVWSRMNY